MAIAKASGHAGYCASHRVPHDQAVAELREITTDPIALAQAAAVVAGGGYNWQSPLHWPLQRPAARLLVDAGADVDELRRHMLVVWGRRNDLAGYTTRPPLEEAELDAIMADLTSDATD